jgi:hypothetical protein
VCSFPDAACSSGRRFGEYSGAQAGTCVLPWAVAIGGEFDDMPPLLAASGDGFELIETFEHSVVDGRALDAVGGTDVLSARVSADRGRISDVEAFGSAQDETARAVRSYGTEGTVLLGTFDGDFELDGTELDSRAGSGCAFLRLRRAGGWVRQIPLSSTDSPIVDVADVSVGPSGEVWAAGSWSGELLALGGDRDLTGPGETPRLPPHEGFLVAYSEDGIPTRAVDMVEMYAPTGPNGYPFTSCEAVAAGSRGLAALCNDGVLVEPADGSATLSFAWDSGIGAEVRRMSVDENGDVVLAGTFQQLAPPGGDAVVAAGDQDLFVLTARIAGPGLETRHLATFGAPGQRTDLRDIALQPGGGAVVVGSTGAEEGSEKQALVVRIDGDGSVTESETFGGAVATAVAIDRQGRVAVAGTFHGTLSVHGRTLTARGGTDAFVLRLP